MKKRERFFKKDSSYYSVTTLREKVNAYFLKNFKISDAWFCDYYLPHREEAYDKTLDVVFFGDFLRKFLEGSLWPFDQYRLWVLSEASKNVMTNFLGVPEECVAVIPRYELFSNGYFKQSFDLKRIEKLYYVGQIRSEKNIFLTLWTIYYLQREFRLNIEFNLVGDFFLGDDGTENERVLFKNKVLKLIDDLDWKIKPILHGTISNFSWQKESDAYALINLSTYFHEDFSLAQACAQENDWYSIVSQWGGFLDVTGSSTVKIPFQMIGNSGESILESKIRGKAIAKLLITENPVDDESHVENRVRVLPKQISDIDLHIIRKKFIQKWGPSLYHVFGNMNLVLDSQKGVAFYEIYQKMFSKGDSSLKKVIMINELDEKILNFDLRINNLMIDQETHFIQIKDLRFKEILQKALAADEIYIPKELINSGIFTVFFEVMKNKIREY